MPLAFLPKPAMSYSAWKSRIYLGAAAWMVCCVAAPAHAAQWEICDLQLHIERTQPSRAMPASAGSSCTGAWRCRESSAWCQTDISPCDDGLPKRAAPAAVATPWPDGGGALSLSGWHVQEPWRLPHPALLAGAALNAGVVLAVVACRSHWRSALATER